MNVNIEEAEPGTVALEVQVDAEQYGQAINDVVDQLARSVQLPGFRKGKAPRAMVERSVDHAAVRARAMEKVLPGAYREAIEESGLEPLGEPEIQILSNESDPDLRFRIVVHKQPEVTPGPVHGVKLTRFLTEISEDEVTEALEELRQSNSTLEPAPDGSVEVGDSVRVTVAVWRDGEPLENVQDELEVSVGRYAHVPAIDDDLVGMGVGEEREIPVTYPLDFRAPELAGTDTIWHVTVAELLKRVTPELDEEFAREHDAESVAELRARVRADLERRARELDDAALREQALSRLLESSKVVFPHILIHQEMEMRLERLERSLARTRHTIQEFAAEQGITTDELHEQIHDQAEADVTEFLLLQKVAAQEGIEVTPEEVGARIEEEGRHRGAREAIIEIEKLNESRRSAVTFDLRREKVLDLVVANAEITEQRQSRTEAASEMETAANESGSGGATSTHAARVVERPSGEATDRSGEEAGTASSGTASAGEPSAEPSGAADEAAGSGA